MGYAHGSARDLPVKKAKPQRRIEEKTVFILSCDGYYALHKRLDTGLLAGLWEFPNVPGKLKLTDAINEVEKNGVKIKEIIRQVEKKHMFTHIEWHMCGIYMEAKEKTEGLIWLPAERIEVETALPTAFRQFWEETSYV